MCVWLTHMNRTPLARALPRLKNTSISRSSLTLKSHAPTPHPLSLSLSPPMYPLTFSLFFLISLSLSKANANPCDERCGPLRLPFPFHLNSSCGPPIPTFRLSCDAAGDHTLYLPLGPTPLRVLSFLPSSASLLLDYSPGPHLNRSPSCDRWYSDVAAAVFLDRSPFLAVTADNVLRLYDCEDSSVCRTGCEETDGDAGASCEGSSRGCCYPLADGSVWKAGDGFAVFKEFGCRGFSSWMTVPPGGGGTSIGEDGRKMERGIEMEWAVPRGYGNGTECAQGAEEVNSTAVRGGVRCACGPGLVGDGFAAGSGCFKSCSDNENTAYDGDCCKGRLCKKKVVVAVGLLISIFFVSAATACYYLLRSPPNKRYRRRDPEQTCLPKILAKACRTRHFTYQELNEATKGFNQDQKLVDIGDGTVHPGVLCDGSLVAVQRMRCETKEILNQVLDRVELLSHIAHKNIARIIGCCISSGHTLLLVHECFPYRTLRDLLQPCRENGPLSWYRRINIATEIASALAHLQSDISPPIKPHSLKSSDIFILSDYSVKIASFKLLSTGPVLVSHDADVHNFGLLLLELIVGSKHEEIILAKIKERRFYEIVDACLRFGEQLPVQCEQIEKLAIFALHCMSRRGLCMVGAAKEFINIVNDNMGGGGPLEPDLQVTFSNSSLLQMISVSPDSLHVP